MSVRLDDNHSVMTASTKLLLAAAAGVAALVLAGVTLSWKVAPLIGWDVAATGYMLAIWPRILRYDAALAKRHALREDPSRVAADAVLILASIASLAAVATVLTGASHATGGAQVALPILSVASVILSWLTVHTVFTLRYAELYFTAPEGGVDFGDERPSYADFAYLAFTLGMTFQVSDTTLQARRFRVVALRHSLLSYLFGTVIIATTINLVAGLAK